MTDQGVAIVYDSSCDYCGRTCHVRGGRFAVHADTYGSRCQCPGSLRRPQQCLAGPLEPIEISLSSLSMACEAGQLPREIAVCGDVTFAVARRRITIQPDGSPRIEYIEDRK